MMSTGPRRRPARGARRAVVADGQTTDHLSVQRSVAFDDDWTTDRPPVQRSVAFDDDWTTDGPSMPRRAVLEDVQPSHWLMILKISAIALSARGRDPGG